MAADPAGAAAQLASLLGPLQDAPPFAQPSDAKRGEVVRKLAQFALKNGPNFVELIKGKQQANPEYQFLFGGQDAGYYAWVLFATACGLPLDQPAPEGHVMPQPAVAQPAEGQQQQQQQQNQPDLSTKLQQAAATLSPDIDSGFSQVLAALTGSKESVKQSQQWFLACTDSAPGMTARMAQHVRGLQEHAKQLHVLYLANDILLKRQSQRLSDGDTDKVALAFKPWLPGMFGAIFGTSGKAEEVESQLQKMLSFWAERRLYDADTLRQLEAAMQSGDADAQLRPPAKTKARKWDQRGQDAPAPAPASAPAQALPQAPAYAVEQHQQQHQQQQQQQQQPGYYAAPQPGYGLPSPGVAHIAPGSTPWSQAQQPPQGWPAQQHGAHQPMPLHQPGMGMAPPMQHAMPPMQPGYGVQPHLSAPYGQLGPQFHQQPAWAPQQGLSPGLHGVPPPFEAPPPVQRPPPPSVTPTSFPSGLIPALVEDKLTTDPPYTPLSPEDIQKAGLPELKGEPTPYLQARLDKFYAELQNWRPGAVREDDPSNSRKARHMEHAGHYAGGSGQPREPQDGSGPPSSGGKPSSFTGLGFNRGPPPTSSLAPGLDDSFASFRQARSGEYRAFIAAVKAGLPFNSRDRS